MRAPRDPQQRRGRRGRCVEDPLLAIILIAAYAHEYGARGLKYSKVGEGNGAGHHSWDALCAYCQPPAAGYLGAWAAEGAHSENRPQRG